MKKNLSILFTLIIAFIAINVQAQEIPPGKNYLGIYAGVSQPVGVFSSTDYYNNKAGLARQSVTYGINWAHYFTKHLAGVVDFSFQDQGRPSSTALQGLSDGYNADFNAQTTTVNITQRYQNFNLLLGPQYSVYFGSFSLDFGASAGFLKSSDTPEYEVDTYETVANTSTTNAYTFYQRSSHALAFAYGGNIGLHLNLSEGFGFVLNGKYVACPGVIVDNDGQLQPNGRMVTSQPINVVQGTLGIFFHF